MADAEVLTMLKRGSWEWNLWREKRPHLSVDLQDAKLSGLDLSNMNLGGPVMFGGTLPGAVLDWAMMDRANLRFATLWGASLRCAQLQHSDLTRAVLLDANLEGADLSGAKLGAADLKRANMSRCSLLSTVLHNTHLQAVDVSGAKMLSTTLVNIDLTQPIGLEEVVHWGPSEIAISTLERTAKALGHDSARQGIIDAFYRSVGLPEDVISFYRSRAKNPIKFHSCFISYSHSDRVFCRRLHEDLQASGVSCWLDDKDLLIGSRILDAVDKAISGAGKILLCCSRSSLQSWWVKDELRKAQDLERRYQRSMIVPLDLDGFIFEWRDGLAADVTSRLVADFTSWGIDDKYEEQLDKLLAALRIEHSC